MAAVRKVEAARRDFWAGVWLFGWEFVVDGFEPEPELRPCEELERKEERAPDMEMETMA